MPSDAEEVAPETAEETQDIFDVSVEEIAAAAGVPDSFIDKLTTSTGDEASEPENEEGEEEVAEEEDTETVEVDESEDDDQEEEAETETEEEPKGDSPGIKKRIGKLVERAKRAEAEAERLQTELTNQQGESQQDNSVPGADRFEVVNDPRKLDKMEADAEHLREWLITNPEGGEYKDRSGGDYEVDYEMAKALHVQTDRDLRKNIPSQRANLQLRNGVFGQANQTFPWMGDNGSAEFVEMASVLSNNARAKKFYESDPQAVMLFGYAVEGYKAVHAAQAKAAKKTAKPVEQAPMLPTTPSRSKRASKNTSGAARQSKLKKQAMLSGEAHDVRSYLESIL